MAKRSSNGKSEDEIFSLYDLLDRLEELLEDMAELGVTSTIEIEAKIAELNLKIDAIEDTGQ